MQLQAYRQQAAQRLRDGGIESASLDVSLLLQSALDATSATLISEASRELSQSEIDKIEALLMRRLAREPAAQIIGYKDFWKDRFIVTQDVLTPRPDSETLIEALLEQLPDTKRAYRILDLGTGSGCLLLSALREYPNAQGIGVDISEAALSIAKQNAQALALQQRCFFVAASWMQPLQSRFDVIISNPPYIACGEKTALAPEVSEYEPAGALYGGEDGLEAYRLLMASLPMVMDKGGIAVIEVGAGQAKDVGLLARRYGFWQSAIKPDLAGIERAMVFIGADDDNYDNEMNITTI